MSNENRKIPDNMKFKKAMAYNQNSMAVERTKLSKVRTDLAFHNSRLSVEQTHLAYLRTIVSLMGTSVTVYKVMPVLGISATFYIGLALFFMAFAVYFIYKDVVTYPKMKKYLAELENEANALVDETDRHVFQLDEE